MMDHHELINEHASRPINAMLKGPPDASFIRFFLHALTCGFCFGLKHSIKQFADAGVQCLCQLLAVEDGDIFQASLDNAYVGHRHSAEFREGFLGIAGLDSRQTNIQP